MTRTEVPMPPDSSFRSVHVTQAHDDGSTELVEVEKYVAVDGEWVDVRDLIEAWRKR